MRWTFNCILLASIAVLSASESTEDDARSKRDLAFIKNLVSAKLGAEVTPNAPKIFVKKSDEYKLFRIPGFEKVLVKAVPKKVGVASVPSSTVVEVSESNAFVEENPSVAIVNSYLGTQRLNETLFALQGVKNLLQSGVLEAQRGSVEVYKSDLYPSVMLSSGKLVGEVQGPVVVEEDLSIPMIEGYKPVEVMRLPDLPMSTKYSYKQFSGSGVTSYTAKDNKNVIVTETNKPMPLPSYLTSRMQEVLLLGAQCLPTAPAGTNLPPSAISVHNVPKIEVGSPVMPPYMSSSSYAQIHPPSVFLTPPPVQVAIPNKPSVYSYSQIRNDGSVTTYSGSGEVVERKGVRPPIIIAEAARPAPLPVYITNRIQKVAASAVAARIPNRIPHELYEAPVVYREPHAVVVEDRPAFIYNHMSRLPVNGANPYRPLYREDVNVHFTNHLQRPVPTNVPSGYSYKTVHAGGSSTTFTDSGVIEEGKKVLVKEGPMLYPAKLPGVYNYQHVIHPHLVKEEICLEPNSAHYPNINHIHSGHAKPGGLSYKTVYGSALTEYSGSAHGSAHVGYVPTPVQNPPVMVPEIVSPGEFFEGDSASGKNIMFNQPVISQYTYKQINHHNPNEITVADVESLPINGEVTVKVGGLSGTKATPQPSSSPLASQSLPVLPSVTPRGPNEFVYVPPADVNISLPTKEPPTVDIGSTLFEHSFTHVTSDGIHSHEDGKGTFENVSSDPVVKIVKTSSSTSTSRTSSTPRKVKRVRVKSAHRSQQTSSTTPKDYLSLSANPIVVMPEEEQSFSFKQDRADGSSITVVGNNKDLSVIEESTTEQSFRGDIPDIVV